MYTKRTVYSILFITTPLEKQKTDLEEWPVGSHLPTANRRRFPLFVVLMLLMFCVRFCCSVLFVLVVVVVVVCLLFCCYWCFCLLIVCVCVRVCVCLFELFVGSVVLLFGACFVLCCCLLFCCCCSMCVFVVFCLLLLLFACLLLLLLFLLIIVLVCFFADGCLVVIVDVRCLYCFWVSLWFCCCCYCCEFPLCTRFLGALLLCFCLLFRCCYC